MQDDLFLCIDQGGSASRAMVITNNGEIIAEARQPVMTQRPQPGWVEHDPVNVVASIREATNSALAQLSIEQKQRLKSAGLVTQRSSLVFWRKDTHRPLTPVISWQDIRGKKILDESLLSFDDIQKKTGLVANAHLGASKYQWCLRELPAVKDAWKKNQLLTGPLASYLVYQLCEKHPHAIDPANAARTLLWNIHRNDWDDELLENFSVPDNILPLIRPTITDWGHIIFDDLRLPLHLVNGDQSSAIFGFGALLPDTAYVNIGTGAFISLPLKELPQDIAPLLCSPCLWRDEAVFLLEGTVHGANSALYDWADKRGKTVSPEDMHDALTNAEPALFINGVGGLGSPDWISEFPSRFIGARTESAQLAAILESIVFLLQRNLTVLQQRTSIAQLVISGGLSQLDEFCQRLADLSGLPVMRPQECEATALGIAYCLASQPASWPVSQTMQHFYPQENTSLLQRHRHWKNAMFGDLFSE
jgi:glycerol kinase